MVNLNLHVFIVPGSWHVPSHCAPLIDALEAQGVSSSTLKLPTCSLSTANIKDLSNPDFTRPKPQKPWPNMYDDADAVKSELQDLVEAGRDVIVVAHSYGGMPASQALTPDLTASARREECKTGGVVGLFGMATFFLPEGMTTVQAAGGPMKETPEQPSGLFTCLDPETNLFNDLPPEQQTFWTNKLVPQSWLVHETPLTNTGYRNVPCAYLKTAIDKMVPLENQQKIIDGTRQMGSTVDVYEVDSGHEPFISHPHTCANAIVGFARKLGFEMEE